MSFQNEILNSIPFIENGEDPNLHFENEISVDSDKRLAYKLECLKMIEILIEDRLKAYQILQLINNKISQAWMTFISGFREKRED